MFQYLYIIIIYIDKMSQKLPILDFRNGRYQG
jgi:hypothetical protein